MKIEKIKDGISIVLMVLLIGMIQIPFFFVNNTYYNFGKLFYLMKIKGFDQLSVLTNAISTMSESASTTEGVVTIQFILLLCYQTLCVLHLFFIIKKNRKIFNILAIETMVAVFVINYMGYGCISENIWGKLYAIPFLIIGTLEFFQNKALEEWERIKQENDEIKRKEIKLKEEKINRLSFSGKYANQFYTVLWKNFYYGWKDYILILVNGVLISAIITSCFSMQDLFGKIYQDENFLMGHGLGRILLNTMLPICICAIFSNIYLLVYYLKIRIQSYSLFVILGLRKRTLNQIITLEIVFCIMMSLLIGIPVGNAITKVIKGSIISLYGKTLTLTTIDVLTYVKVCFVIVGMYVISLTMLKEIVTEYNLISPSEKRIKREKMPRKRLLLFSLLGIFMCGLSTFLYSHKKNHESIIIILMLCIGVYLTIRYGGTLFLKKFEGKKFYYQIVLKINHLYHYSKTSANYVCVLFVVHFFVTFYFLIQIVTIYIAESPEDLYPYDYVCIANESDLNFFKEIEQKYDATIEVYSMVRVTTPDQTEMLEGQSTPAQGQQIGISESTYHILKKKLDPNYQNKLLELDLEGKYVYIVHQQDKATKAQPIDFSMGVNNQLHLKIGQPIMAYEKRKLLEIFPKRIIIGEEYGSIIGCFGGGRVENIVVFSDEYFVKAQGMWKNISIFTGEYVDEVGSSEIYQGPNKLVLINVNDKKLLDSIEAQMKILKNNHMYDDSIDSSVHCYYSKKNEINDMALERILKINVNIFGICVMIFLSIYLTVIKALTEINTKSKRAFLLKCIGWTKKERNKIIKAELRFFYIVPATIVLLISIFFTSALFQARMYSNADILECLKIMIPIWGLYLLFQGGVFKLIELWTFKKMEDKGGRK